MSDLFGNHIGFPTRRLKLCASVMLTYHVINILNSILPLQFNSVSGLLLGLIFFLFIESVMF